MKLTQILALVTFLLMVAVNGLANALPINGITTGEVSDSYPVLFTPAGYVFSIWGVIYLLLLGFSIYQALPAQRENAILEKVRPWYIAGNLFNTIWIFFWHYQMIPVTILLMLGLLASLIVIYQRLGTGLRKVTTTEFLFVNLPFSVYLGWITVATVANTTVLLYDLGWNGFGIPGQFWTALVLLVAVVLGSILLWQRRDIAYNLVLVWAFIGIYFRQSDTPTVAYTALALAVLLLAGVVFAGLRTPPGRTITAA